jgi:catechol 2,3-dioxygenase-like lactoylglutathione lyase family enzyme
METAVAPTARDQATASTQPRFSGLSHVSLACRDLVESKLFYSAVLGGERVHEIRGFVEYRIADVIFGLAEQNQGWTARDHEYPHYAFYLDGPNFERMIHWLDLYDVAIYPYRRDSTALLYFRDPSGNLFALYCGKCNLPQRDSSLRLRMPGMCLTDLTSATISACDRMN